MRKLLAILTAVLVLCLAVGCGNDADKGKNRDKDKPRAAIHMSSSLPESREEGKTPV